MKFDWAKFFTTLATVAEPITVGIFTIIKDGTNSQKALDALNLATGVTEALGSGSPTLVAGAQAASAIGATIISGIAASHPALNPAS